MGPCLSTCLGSRHDDDEVDENTQLLSNAPYDTSAQEAKMLKEQQRRQQELNVIVNELQDNLIDVTNFLDQSNPATPDITFEDDEAGRFPLYVSGVIKRQIETEMTQIGDTAKQHCKVEPVRDLYIKF
ncbi:hypothetical protein DICA3_C18382 [Diutina catenulata]